MARTMVVIAPEGRIRWILLSGIAVGIVTTSVA